MVTLIVGSAYLGCVLLLWASVWHGSVFMEKMGIISHAENIVTFTLCLSILFSGVLSVVQFFLLRLLTDIDVEGAIVESLITVFLLSVWLSVFLFAIRRNYVNAIKKLQQLKKVETSK